jgi:hypothetical protein
MFDLIVRRLWIALALLVVLGAGALQQPRAAYACSCMAPPPPLEARDGSAAVFAGQVAGITPNGPSGVLVTFDLQQSWKGPAGPQLTIATGADSAGCGFTFTQGEQYLVYGFAQEGQLWTSLCSRTAPLANAGDDLAALGAGNQVDGAAAPVTTSTMGIPWLPLAIGGLGVLLLIGLIAGWQGRR